MHFFFNFGFKSKLSCPDLAYKRVFINPEEGEDKKGVRKENKLENQRKRNQGISRRENQERASKFVKKKKISEFGVPC